jgi:uncharacterized protein (DUF58 family)
MRLIARTIGALLKFLYQHHNILIVLWAFGTMAALAGISGYWMFYRAAYALGALIPICFVWARIQSGGLEVSVERMMDRLQVGQQAEATVRLKSRSAWTKLWLQVEDQTDMPGASPRTVLTLPSKSTRNWRVNMQCNRRGVYSAIPLVCSSSADLTVNASRLWCCRSLKSSRTSGRRLRSSPARGWFESARTT